MPEQDINIGAGTAVVTGAANGIGRAVALELARKGADLVIADIDESGLSETAGMLEDLGARVLTRRLDAGSEEDNEALAQAAFDWAEKPINLVLANAGIHGLTNALEPDIGVWQRAVHVNLWGPIFASKAFVKRLMDQGEVAQFAVTASQASLIAAPGMSPYCATKHAVWAIADCLRMELAQAKSAVGVTIIAPGRTASGITGDQLERVRASQGEDAAKAYAAQLVTSEKVADVIVREIVKRPFWIVPADVDTREMVRARVDAFESAVPIGLIKD